MSFFASIAPPGPRPQSVERAQGTAVSDQDLGAMTLVFGTSANPPTGMAGHAGMVSALSSAESLPSSQGSLQPAAVWVPVVFEHPFVAKRDLADFEHRLRMAKLNIEGLGYDGCPIDVLDTERQIQQRLHANGETARHHRSI